MKTKKIPLILIPIFFLFLSISNVSAQNSSSIKGTIKDKSGEGLAGANIKIVNTNYGTSTDLEGNFELKNIPAGTHTLEASYVGFKTVTKSVVVSNSKARVVNFVLQNSVGVLDEVTIKGQSFKEKNSVATVGIVSTNEIKDLMMTAEQPLRIVEKVAGVNIASYGQGGVADTYTIRGFRGAHSGGTGADVDGISLNETGGHDGYSDINVIVPLNIARVKVYKGPSSVLHGRFSQGGTLAVETRRGGEYNDISLKAGSYGTIDAQYAQGSSIKLKNSDKAIQTNFAGQVYQTDGYVTNYSQVLRGNVEGTISYPISDKTDISLSLRAHKSNWNAPGYIQKDQFFDDKLRRQPHKYAENDTGARKFFSEKIDLNHRISENVKLLVFAYALQQKAIRLAKFNYALGYKQDLDGYIIGTGGQSERGYKRDAYALGTSLEGNSKIAEKDFDWIAGLEYYYEDSKKNNWRTSFGKRLKETEKRFFDVHSISVFAKGELDIHKLFRPSIGFRYDTYSGDYNGWFINRKEKTIIENGKMSNLSHISPKLGFRSTLAEGLDFRASASNGFSLPGKEDKYTKKDLEPSTSWQYEVGLSFTKDSKYSFDISGFILNRSKEVMTVGDRRVNVGKTSRAGVETELEVEITKGFDLYGTASYITTEVVEHPKNKGKKINGIPSTTASLGLSYTSNVGFGADVNFRNVGEYFIDGGNKNKYDGYSLVNLTLFQNLDKIFSKNGKIFFVVNNLFNEKYASSIWGSSALSYSPGPTRNYSFGVNYSF